VKNTPNANHDQDDTRDEKEDSSEIWLSSDALHERGRPGIRVWGIDPGHDFVIFPLTNTN
jgi:hypothetical protein